MSKECDRKLGIYRETGDSNGSIYALVKNFTSGIQKKVVVFLPFPNFFQNVEFPHPVAIGFQNFGMWIFAGQELTAAWKN
jgi:hypothetical protein